jgi:hypothetical protein
MTIALANPLYTGQLFVPLDNKLKGFCMGGGGFISWLVLIPKHRRTRPYKFVEIGDFMNLKPLQLIFGIVPFANLS